MVLLLIVSGTCASAQDKKPEPKDQPRVIVALPLGVTPGVKARVTLRGLKLDTATEVRCTDSGAVLKILGKGKAAVPNQQEPARVGDTQLEIELTIPSGKPAGTTSLVAVTPSGESPPYALIVNGSTSPLAEKEQNPGFRQAQPIQPGQTIEGAIGQPQDVDVFRLEGQANRTLVIEVVAARHGSPLDAVLMLYDAAGQEVAGNDDSEHGSDARLTVKLPRTGVYYLSLLDAHDQGGPVHVYRLVVAMGK
jgi:hypothetical protein